MKASPARDYAHNVAARHCGDECLVWPYARTPDGYGVVSSQPASRYICKLVHGDPPTAIHQAAHSCGKGREGCVNPRHLRWATPAENGADKVRHGTSAGTGGTTICGEAVKGSKLKEEDVRRIRALKDRMGLKDVAKMFGVNPVHIWRIQTGKKWAHVA